MTDRDALQERIARALRSTREFQAGASFGIPAGAYVQASEGLAAAVLPLIAAEVQAAYDNGYDDGRFDGECTSYTRPEDRPYRATDYEKED